MDTIHDDMVSTRTYHLMLIGVSIAVILECILAFPQYYNDAPVWLQDDLWEFRIYIKEWVGSWGPIIGILFAAHLVLSIMKGFYEEQFNALAGLGLEGVSRLTKWYTKQDY